MTALFKGYMFMAPARVAGHSCWCSFPARLVGSLLLIVIAMGCTAVLRSSRKSMAGHPHPFHVLGCAGAVGRNWGSASPATRWAVPETACSARGCRVTPTEPEHRAQRHGRRIGRDGRRPGVSWRSRFPNRSLPRTYITVQDAVTRYAIPKHDLSVAQGPSSPLPPQPGDTRTYLSVHELDAMMRIQQADRAADNDSSMEGLCT